MVMEEQEIDMELASERIPVPRVRQPKLDTVKRNKSGILRGKPRLRKKALHTAIRKQMEFYFSDANLSKDRYLAELLKESPYINLDVFRQFNKMSSLTTDTSRIAKALQGSTMLKVSEDGTKVCRFTPINRKENVDECTIYVQNLPPDSDHDWLISIFSKYGPVVYVSIPRYKSNKKIKGFAFIEFDTPISVKKCIEAFREKGCVLPTHTSPDDLLSITTFDNTKKDVISKGFIVAIENHGKQEASKDRIQDDNAYDNKVNRGDSNSKQVLGKRKLATEKSYVMDENNVKIKKRKVIIDQSIANHRDGNSNMENQETAHFNESVIDRNKITKTDIKKKKKLTVNDAFDIENNDEEMMKKNLCDSVKSDKNKRTESIINDDIDIEKEKIIDEKKKKKNRKKKSKIQEDIHNVMGLQVMAKRDWKCLRNKYLELQKSKMQQLKLHLKKARWNYDKAGQNCDKFKHEQDTEKLSEVDKLSCAQVTYTPGIIVKIKMDEPCADPQRLKAELRDNNCIKYIDITHGSCEAYIRCDTAETAQTFVQKSHKGKRFTILEGEEEKSYWDKIERDRKEKLNSRKRYKHRGRDKLLKRAEKELGKCIKFD